MTSKITIKKIGENKYLIPRSGGMKVDSIIFASDKLLTHIKEEEVYKQLINVAYLPGIEKYSIGMPDIHWGYGFPIGGVAAISVDDNGVVSPGGVGSDINCGVRVILTPFDYKEFIKHRERLINSIFNNVPAGVGLSGKVILNKDELQKLVEEGVKWCIEKGYGIEEDIERIEDNGKLKNGSLEYVSKVAIERGRRQIGTLGAGNHFLEIQRVDKIFDNEIAEKFGLFTNQIVIMLHTGSRGFGYQIAEDYVQKIQSISISKYKINIPDRQLASVPINSKEGKEYLSAMAAAANYAWVNREMITYFIRKSFKEVMKVKDRNLSILYDVAHNIAKFEKHKINNKLKTVLVHRKGATRAFPAKTSILSQLYYDTGHPVIIPGDMGDSSYILVGLQKNMEESFGTVCHGAGRILSRRKAKKIADKNRLKKDMEKKDILLKSKSWRTVAEEIPEAYKDIEEVIKVVENNELAKKIVKLTPIAVIKG